MLITIKTTIAREFKSDPYIATLFGYRDDPTVNIDIVKTNPKLLDSIYERLEATRADPTAKKALTLIRLYRDTLKNPNNTKPRTLQHMVACLRAFINQGPHITLFKKDEMDDRWLPYVVTEVKYTPRDKYTPAQVKVHIAYYDTEEVRVRSIVFDATDLHKPSVGDMLREDGYVLETPELLAEYEKDVAHYRKLANEVGLQVNGYRYGTSVGDRWSSGTVSLETDGRPALLVIDDENEDDEGNARKVKRSAPTADSSFWGRANYGTEADPAKMQRVKDSEEEEPEEEVEEDEDGEVDEEAADRKVRKQLSEHFPSKTEIADPTILKVPVHPYITCFDLRRHARVNVHAWNLKPYEYNEHIIEKLVIPDDSKELVNVLIENATGHFEDIVKGKSGGSIILCAGTPGTGKTLTAEVYAEVMKRPLYTVQCSQLGLSHEELEKKLIKVMARAMRWKAILLIDEADVYIADRGKDVRQNAIVGIFLRVLEYYNGVMFMTTNRSEDIDDAIASRATAKLVFDKPTPEQQVQLWGVLSKGSVIPLEWDHITAIVEKHDDLTGRDIKNLLKLSAMLAAKRGEKAITPELVSYVRQFKKG